METEIAVSKEIVSYDRENVQREDRFRSIDEIIQNRLGKIKFEGMDVCEYTWERTHYIYGRGHFVGKMTFVGRRTQEKIPILFTDNNVWSTPIYRHNKQKRQFFVPGITKGAPQGDIFNYEFYPLSGEEKAEVKQIINKEYGLRICKEADALEEVYSSYFENLSKFKQIPGQIILLFGEELYKGENKEKFREKRNKNSRPYIEIYV